MKLNSVKRRIYGNFRNKSVIFRNAQDWAARRDDMRCQTLN